MVVDLIKLIVRVLFRLFYFAKIEGLEKIPREGKLIIACNHLSNADPFFVGSFAGKVREVKFLAKKELFKNKISAWIFKGLGCVSLDRKKASGDLGALKLIIKMLSEEKCVIMFPEGTRSKTGYAGKAKAGVGFIAYKSKAPVLCAKVFNTYKFPFTLGIRLKFGNTLFIDDKKLKSKDKYQEFSNIIMEEISSIK